MRKIADLVVCVEYEHRKRDGELVSRGKQFIDKNLNVHIIREDATGKKVAKVVVNKRGDPLYEKLFKFLKGVS